MKNSRKGILVLRADADADIGTGHIMRCYALAAAWHERGGQAVFLSNLSAPPIVDRLKQAGMELVRVPETHPAAEDLILTRKVLEDCRAGHRNAQEIVAAIDGYHFGPEFQRQVKEKANRLLMVSDMVAYPFYEADVILNQNFGAENLSYPCGEKTRVLLGSRYVLLRPEFLRWSEWTRKTSHKGKRVLVTMGGSDPENVSSSVIEALSLMKEEDLEVKVVIGPASPHRARIEEKARTAHGRISCVYNPPDLSIPMQWADLAVTAAGTTCWELCFMMVPCVTVTLAENQRVVAQGLETAGVSWGLGEHMSVSPQEITERAREILHDPKRREHMALSGRRLVDGHGASRVVEALSSTT
jgi:UDP-2,4-diacetamido-2,4,6-trideoxy-beta-L-altropyranose hydrolase